MTTPSRIRTGTETASPEADKDWFAQRIWCQSGNKVLTTGDGAAPPAKTLARHIYHPRSADEIAALVKSSPATTPIACLCGGHESSNTAALASSDAVILDLAHLKSIEFHRDDEGTLVTVGAGVLNRELVEALKQHQLALPVGTGPGVGVVGYIVNGGLSGYFSRRLGLLGQRAVKLTMVTAAGDIRVLTPENELFTAMLGAGSALGIVVDVTVRAAPESVVQSAEQRIFSFETREQAVEFSRSALGFMKEHALPDESVSMELVVTGTKALVVTMVFYDSFQGSTTKFVKPLEDLAASLNLPVAMEFHWTSWYETAAALWPVIDGMKGSPLATLQHCMGTKDIPDDEILEFVCDTAVRQAPLDEAELSILEIRTLGGAALSGTKLPSGNCHHTFFADLITLYDAGKKTAGERQAIADLTRRLVEKARNVDNLTVDFSGTHSQPDDADYMVSARDIFGTEAMAENVKALKKKTDRNNRFKFHPFAKLI
ncbi:MAG: FAD-binding oxidoreductase [Chthoniobacterales bacterium]